MTFKEYYKRLILQESETVYSENVSALKIKDRYESLFTAAYRVMQKNYPFFYELLARMNVIHVFNSSDEQDKINAEAYGWVNIPDIETMAVDSKGNILINVSFATLKLGFKEVVGVLCHEVLHIGWKHLDRLGARHPELWNIATDLVINYTLIKESVPLPSMGIIPTGAGDYVFKEGTRSKKPEKINVRDKTAEQVYAELEDILDIQQVKDSVKDGKAKTPDFSRQSPGVAAGIPQPLDDHDYQNEHSKEAKSQGGEVSNKTPDQIIKDVDSAMDAARKQSGFGQGEGGILQKIGTSQKAELDWKRILNKVIRTATTTTRKKPMYNVPHPISHSAGFYEPASITQPDIDIDVVAAMDVSGSIRPRDADKFRGEIIKLSKDLKMPIEVLYWDTIVSDTEIINSGRSLGKSKAETQIRGGGGTDMTAVKNYLEEHKRTPQLVIYFTDGYIPQPTFINRAQRLFIITKDGQTHVVEPFGKTVRLLD